MKAEQLSDAINGLDDTILAEAQISREKRSDRQKSVWQKSEQKKSDWQKSEQESDWQKSEQKSDWQKSDRKKRIWHRRDWQMARTRWLAAAASLAVLATGVYGAVRLSNWRSGSGFWSGTMENGGSMKDAGSMQDGASAGDGAYEDSTEYDDYEGPLFPLTTDSGAGELVAERSIIYEFVDEKSRERTYTDEDGRTVEYTADNGEAEVADRYILRNKSDKEVNFQAIYPFAACLSDSVRAIPEITVDGKNVEGELHIGPCIQGYEGIGVDENGDQTRGSVEDCSSWEDHKKLFSLGYMKRAFDGRTEVELPVVVYEVKSLNAPEELDAATLALEYSIDYGKTTLLSYGFNGFERGVAEGTGKHSFFVDHPADKAYLIVIGEDIRDCALAGYRNGGLEQDNRVDTVTGIFTRRESTIGEILSELWLIERSSGKSYDLVDNLIDYGEKTIRSTLTDAEMTGEVEEFLSDRHVLPVPSLAQSGGEMEYTGVDSLEEVFDFNVFMDHRVMYLSVPVTIPAGGTVEFSASMLRKANELGHEIERRYGYDVVTQLGSELDFSTVSAALASAEGVEIVGQNFGFDPREGVTSVTLDPEKKYYYMNMRVY